MDSDRYLDREASELEYHARVLARAEDETLPLLERIKFVAIFSTLTDEFFRVRVAGLQEQRSAGVDALSRGGHTPAEQLDTLRQTFRELLDRHASVLQDDLLPGLAAAGVHIKSWDDLDEGAKKHLGQLFEEQIKPILTPLAVGPAHPFPFISDLSLSIGVMLDDVRGPGFGRVKVPETLDRFIIAGPDRQTDGELILVAVEEVIGAHLDQVFPGREVKGWSTFRVTRNADYDVEDVDIDDLLDTIASELLERRFGRATRLTIDPDVPDEIAELLLAELELEEADLFVMPRPLDLGAFWQLYKLDRPELKEEAWRPVRPAFFDNPDLFAMLRSAEHLVHHPYDSFAATTLRFIETAATDPSVLAIKQTLYRTSGDSPIVHALIRAAENGKQVAALVELKARFDEEANIRWAEQLEEAGVHVVYGFVDLKTHTKTALVVRREENGDIRRYGHIGTGNYHPQTADSYEDLAMFTTDPVLTADIAELFNLLTTYSRDAEFDRLLAAPVNLLERIVEFIDDQAHEGGRIVMKVNNLTHNDVIDALYRASQAGASIDLVLRSICCLRPGVESLSENIRVRSIVGPFLEHSRILKFGADPAPGAYLIGSADMMTRNLENRVEAVAPVDDPELRARLDQALDLCLADTELAWTLDDEGTWTKVDPGDDPVNVQASLKQAARERAVPRSEPVVERRGLWSQVRDKDS